MPPQLYTALLSSPPTKEYWLTLEDRDSCEADDDEKGEELLHIRGGRDGNEPLPANVVALIKSAADTARTSVAASAKKQSAATANAMQQPVHPNVRPSRTVPSRSSVPSAAVGNNQTKRKRPSKVCVSPSSPIFEAMREIRSKKENNLTINDLAACDNEWLRFALAGVIKPGAALFKVEHKIWHKKTFNKHANSRATTRRSLPYFRSNHYKAIWLENKIGCAQEVTDILQNACAYPLYITFQRFAMPADGVSAKTNVTCNPPPAKRLKTDPIDKITSQPKNDVICLLDSSDEEDEPEISAKSGAFTQQTISMNVATSSPEPLPVIFTSSYEPPADPEPPSFKAACNGDFVLTPYGAGKIVSSRVERRASTSGDTSIFNPTIIFTIDLHFGICHVPSHQVKTISGTSYVSKPLLTYNKVPITAMDLLRLRPMTYLNDSIVNFYLKYLKARTENDNETVSSGRGWDDLDGTGVYIFPSFCYNRIICIMGKDNRNNKANRLKIWKELKTWTKGTDIFKKRMLVFPINYNLHWTALFVFHPGRLIRKHENAKTTAIVASVQGQTDANADDAAVKTPKPPASPNGSLKKALSGIKQCIVDIVNHIASPLRKSTDPTQRLPPSNQASNPNQESATRWECDFCQNVYNTFDAAREHEKKCIKNRDCCMLHFDSGKHFKLHDSQTIAGNVRKYLSAYYDGEYASTHPNVGALTQANLPSYSISVPQQDNTKDCGVYMLENVERMMTNPPTVDNDFVKNTCKLFAKELYRKDVIQKKREDILQLLHKLREGQDVS